MKVISLVVGLTVGVLLMVGLVSPVVAEGQNTAGNLVEYSNPTNDGNYYMRELKNGDTLVCTTTSGENTTLSVNGELITTIDGAAFSNYHTLLMTNVFTCNTGNSTSGLQIASYDSTSVGYTGTVTISYNDGVITQTAGESSTEFPGVTWGYIICNAEEAEYYESIRTGSTPFYIKSDKDIICGGVYTTGENDTYYWYKDGVCNVAQDYDASYTINKTLAENTTDIYQASIEITVGEESFVPYRILIPIEVTGHATSGANYALLGAIPIVAFIALIAFAAFAVRGRMDD